MTHNETRISNERLAEIGAKLIEGYRRSEMNTDAEFWEDVLQALRSTPVEVEPVAWLKVWTSNIGAFSAPGRRVDFSPNLEPWLEPLTPTVTPLYARPFPNPSPSDGEVSEAATLDEKALAAAVCAAAAEAQDETNGRPAGNIVAIGCEENGYNDPVDAAASFITSMARAAVSAYLETLKSSKRGQP